MSGATGSEPNPAPPRSLTLKIGSRRGGPGLAIPVRLRVVPAALLIVLVHLLLTLWRLSRCWWWQDDLNLIAKATGRSLPGLLVRNYNGHLVPGSWLMAWAIGNGPGFTWWPAMLEQLVLVAAIDVTMLALLVRLFGPRPAILLPLTISCSTGVLLVSTFWWAAGMQWLPTSLALLLALWFHVGYLARGRPRDAIGAVGAVVLGLLFFEKAVTIVVVLAAFTALYAVPGPFLGRSWRALRRCPWYWAAHAAVIGGYLAVYLSRARTDTAPARSLAEVLRLVQQMVLHNLVPGMVGGPIQWYGPLSSLPTSPRWFLDVSWVVAGVTVAGSLLLVRGAWRAWLLLAVPFAISVTLVAQTRLGVIGPTIGRDGRYLTDVALLAAVCVGLAWLPIRPALEGEDAIQARDPAAKPPAVPILLGAAVGLGIAVCGAVSAQRYVENWSVNPSRSYLANLQHDLDAAAAFGVTPVMFDQRVPESMMISSFGRDAMLGNVSRPLRHRPAFANWTTRLVVVDGDGHLRRGAVSGRTVVPPGGTVCGPAGGSGTVVGTGSPPPAWEYTIRIGYAASGDTNGVVRFGTGQVAVHFTAGLHEVYVRLVGTADRVIIGGLDAGAGVCVGEVDIGHVVPAG